MNGWQGKILHIDLTTKKHSIQTPCLEIYKKYIGGRGLAGYYLRNFVKESPCSARMPLLFFTGPLVDTPSPASGRMTVMSRSPLTGTVCDTSVGGRLGVQIKRAGYDGIVVTGKNPQLCGICICDSKVEIVEASSLKAKEISDVMSVLVEKGSSVAIVGPAAEAGVLFSCISIDGHFFSGRGGLGLVMASKNLKYLKVGGTSKTTVYSKDELNLAREEILRLTAASPILTGSFGISNYGTPALYDLMHTRRMMPTSNFKATYFKSAPAMNAWQYKQKYQPKKKGCFGCHILCKKQAQDRRLIPEFETMSHFSALIDNTDLDVVVEANRICNETGMDTISAAATLACYAEISRIKLTPPKIIKLLSDIAYSRDEGQYLKLGSYRYAESKGCVHLSMTVKKQELPAYDPRGALGMALAYAVSTRGGCHLRAYPISHEILRKPVATDRFTFSGKARIIKIGEDLNAVVDSLTACKFLFFAASLEEYSRAFYGVTAVKTSAQDLLKAGERIFYNERLMNAACGFGSRDDDLPPRFFSQAGSSGESITVNPINREEFLTARRAYYKIRGLDREGMPLRQKCGELGIEWINF
ncbi:MAG: aldehyde ferredoxin oxidoreductase family protein [Candidatus Omnitrophota bacterium]|nr:MAG: aldehyde ferredoxin oxidoreductase family protein [Candidatus Omnitrophota bacterium]